MSPTGSPGWLGGTGVTCRSASASLKVASAAALGVELARTSSDHGPLVPGPSSTSTALAGKTWPATSGESMVKGVSMPLASGVSDGCGL